MCFVVAFSDIAAADVDFQPRTDVSKQFNFSNDAVTFKAPPSISSDESKGRGRGRGRRKKPVVAPGASDTDASQSLPGGFALKPAMPVAATAAIDGNLSHSLSSAPDGVTAAGAAAASSQLQPMPRKPRTDSLSSGQSLEARRSSADAASSGRPLEALKSERAPPAPAAVRNAWLDGFPTTVSANKPHMTSLGER